MSKFEDNGGYFIDNVPYMDCKVILNCKDVQYR